MSTKKILVIFGVTGNQGGSVVEAILSNPLASAQFQLRGVTRDPSKPTSLALSEKGVEVVKADLADKESLNAALKGAYAVFAVTNWQEILNKETEIQYGKNIADASKEQNIQHLIWSSLPNVTKQTKGAITGVLHFDSKAIVEEYIREIGVPATFILFGIFSSHIPRFFSPSPTSAPEKKSYLLTTPVPSSTAIPIISIQRDAGKFVVGALLNRASVLGRQVLAGENYYSLAEVTEILRTKGGLDVTSVQISDEQYRAGLGSVGYPDWLQDDMSCNMRSISEYGFYHGADMRNSYEDILTEPLETFPEWVANSEEVAALK